MSPFPRSFRHPRCPHSRLGSHHCHSRKRPQADCHQAAKPGDCGVQCALKRCAQRRAHMLQARRQCRCGASRAGLPSLGRSPRRVGVSGTRSRGPPIHGFPEEAPQLTSLRARAAHRGSATSEGPVGAISVRSAGSIKLPSAVVLSCQGGSRRAIGERVKFSSLLCALVGSFIVGFRIEIRAYFHEVGYLCGH